MATITANDLRFAIPDDFALQSDGENIWLSCTLKTQHELEAIIWALRCASSHLPSSRKAVAADFGLQKPKKTYRDSLIDAGIMQ